MAFITADHSTAAAGTGFWAAVSRAFDSYARARSRVDQIEALDAKTDAELADMGLTRDRIVQYVFRDVMSV